MNRGNKTSSSPPSFPTNMGSRAICHDDARPRIFVFECCLAPLALLTSKICLNMPESTLVHCQHEYQKIWNVHMTSSEQCRQINKYTFAFFFVLILLQIIIPHCKILLLVENETYIISFSSQYKWLEFPTSECVCYTVSLVKVALNICIVNRPSSYFKHANVLH